MKREEDHQSEKKKEPKKEVRDLPPEKDVKGGNSKDTRRDSNRTGEVDFMQDF